MKIIDFSKAKATKIVNLAEQIKSSVSVIDPFQIAQIYGIDCTFSDIDTPLAYSYYDRYAQKFCIQISEYVDQYSAKILCYHELGHIFCEESTAVNLFDNSIDPLSEFTANFFAACFLPLDNYFEINDDTTVESFNEHIYSQVIARHKPQLLD